MITRGVHHVSLCSRDLARARAFYGELLGLPEIERPALGIPGVWYQAGPVQLHVIVTAGSEDHASQSLTPLANHIAFAIDDYEGVAQRLEQTGHAVVGLGADAGQLFLHDPDGNTIELIRADLRRGGPDAQER